MLTLSVSFIGIKHTPGLFISRTFSLSQTEILYPCQILPVPSFPAPCSHHSIFCLIGLLSVPRQNYSTCSSVSVFKVVCSPFQRQHDTPLCVQTTRCWAVGNNAAVDLELNKNPVEGFSAGLIDDNDLYRWEVLIIGPPDTLYEGGVFKAHLTFPKDYPLRPPKMKFITEIWHPNVDKNGDVCISILHEPGEDKYGYEKPEERWLPIHTVETIMISVISMLADPNGDSPANVDAAKEWREDRNGEFKRKVARCVRKSQETAFE
ncbi:ubiquitin-conjugating enzyme E2 G1 isoform X1 [Ailuropoda melanoleuca]|uniref:ubiquitin-conjugating enzyme E2 G1 isoform X1 n=1 Tax=Ailuropoda melanoleuca TaxID=9646 RepID=UPI0014940E0D|nr:ubiquitin-conjugating enzyme E2 G1 isoform X1 [Ailuropoda melanoleuca]